MMEDKPEKEVRNTLGVVSITGPDTDKRTVEGYAMLFDTPSDGLWFEEKIERGALDGVLDKSDVFDLLDHNQSRGVLARWKRKAVSLNLIVDEKGLKYSFKAPRTALGDELLEYIERGEIDSSSFSFTVEKDTWEYLKDGKVKRTIHKIAQLYDVSQVYNAAYSKTTVSLRGKEDLDKQIREQEEERNSSEREEYYKSIESQLSKF